MDVLVTGSHGTVGTALTEQLPEAYDYTLLDRRRVDGDHPHATDEYETVVADVADYDAIRPAFDGQDAVVHLAGHTDPEGTFDDLLDTNIVGTHTVFEAARDAGVNTVVFASTNHVVGMYEVANEPDIYFGTDIEVDHESPVRPDSEYASSKAAGEVFGRQYAENHGMNVYALRIGSVRDPAYDHPFGDAERGVDEGRWARDSDDYRTQAARMSCLWQSRRDIAHMVDCSLQDDSVRFDVFYGLSDNERAWFDIDHAREKIGYDPYDSADDWDMPPR
ncbi:NAD dependent epimerase/dehydratase family protein [Halogranum gelatinilyticum]|uniref:NAD dependent epimerase/dehydratase family protein n=1 Tax=Halogranum gelatinilyticum TaxID=660521 RepID=A0A1G9VKR9_9EURY|nr:NAD(P)-dependent oxidoreductase [Halogranum gelatinilyticum]SDM72700.1 NAD dependent epimerase/dehydratase family protein [Halogranum gelatinilyticum]